MQPLVFDLTPKEVPVQIGEDHFILREAQGSTVIKFRNLIFQATNPGLDGQARGDGEGLADVEAFLVSQCLYRTKEPGVLPKDGNGRPDRTKLVAKEIITEWVYNIQRTLFETIKEISDIDRDTPEGLAKEKEDLAKRERKLRESQKYAKNFSGSTEDGSS